MVEPFLILMVLNFNIKNKITKKNENKEENNQINKNKKNKFGLMMIFLKKKKMIVILVLMMRKVMMIGVLETCIEILNNFRINLKLIMNKYFD